MPHVGAGARHPQPWGQRGALLALACRAAAEALLK